MFVLTATRYYNPHVEQVITRGALAPKAKGIRVYSRHEGGRRPRHPVHARKRILICPKSNRYTWPYVLLERG
jgi:hypothetical protein